MRRKYNGTGTSNDRTSANGINHERSWNIRHNRPKIILNHADNQSCHHISWNSDTGDGTGTLTVRAPSGDEDPRASGRLIIISYASYRGVANKLTIRPTVTDANGNALNDAWAH